MNNLNYKLHYYQKELLKKLTFSTSLKFNELNIDGLESEHMNYHLKKLLDIGFIVKKDGVYELTDKGKDYTNLMSDDIKFLEKQPKISMVIKPLRKNKKGELEWLLMRRLRQPYYGKAGNLTGKPRFGELFQDAVVRELYEETGLSAKTFILDKIYRKLRRREDGEFVQDVLFVIYYVTDLSGDLIEKTEFQENFWISQSELEKNFKSLDLYDDFTLEKYSSVPKGSMKFKESVDVAKGF